MNDWVQEFPTEQGWYWFYGYRYGKTTSCLPGDVNELELLLVEVILTGKSMTYIAGGQYMYECEVETDQYYFKPMVPPTLPEWIDN